MSTVSPVSQVGGTDYQQLARLAAELRILVRPRKQISEWLLKVVLSRKYCRFCVNFWIIEKLILTIHFSC